MNRRHSVILLCLLVPACSRPVPPTVQVVKATTQSQVEPQSQPQSQVEPQSQPQVETETQAKPTVDFEQLLQSITKCNEEELSFFHQHWNKIHKQLVQATADKSLTHLPVEQQEELWFALAYLQGCRHPSIMKEHGDDMVDILRGFGSQQQRDDLKWCFPTGTAAIP